MDIKTFRRATPSSVGRSGKIGANIETGLANIEVRVAFEHHRAVWRRRQAEIRREEGVADAHHVESILFLALTRHISASYSNDILPAHFGDYTRWQNIEPYCWRTRTELTRMRTHATVTASDVQGTLYKHDSHLGSKFLANMKALSLTRQSKKLPLIHGSSENILWFGSMRRSEGGPEFGKGFFQSLWKWYACNQGHQFERHHLQAL